MKPRYPYVVILDIKGLERITLEFGPLVPIALVRRLCGKSKARVYKLLSDGRLRGFSVAGQLCTPVADAKKIWGEGK